MMVTKPLWCCSRAGRIPPHVSHGRLIVLRASKRLASITASATPSSLRAAISSDGLPNTFVPGRNLVFLTFAAALAYRRGIRHIIGGMCETDYSGYPDCRDATIKTMNAALNLGMGRDFQLHTPLMWLDKAATWKLAHDLGGAGLVDLIRDHSHTCYLGERGARHDWGHGCGKCPACALRAKGWRDYVAREKSAALLSSSAANAGDPYPR